MSAIISLHKVSKQYTGNHKAGVSNLHFSIDSGEFVAVIGESGSGKSTLLKLIYGLIAPDEGEILFKNQRILGPQEKLIPGHDRMKLVAQDFNLNAYARVYDNIASMLSNDDLASKREKTLETMSFLRIEHLAEKRTVDLSGGEQQRVAIARAIITQPEVLLLDEPFSQVDTILKHELRADLHRLSRFLGITIVLVSHDPMDGLSLADRLLIIKEGELVQAGQPAEVVKKPVSGYVASLIGNANVLTVGDAMSLFSIQLTPNQNLIIYPDKIQPGVSEIQGVVKKVLFKLFYDEVIIRVEPGIDLLAHAKTFAFKEGEVISFSVTDYIVTEE